MIEISEMNNDEYQKFIDDSYIRYIEDLSYDTETFIKLTGKQPKEFAEGQFKTFLPKGQETPNHWFYKVNDADNHDHVGYLWLIYREDKGLLFIGDIFINEPVRGKGYGTKILEWIEDIAQSEHYTNIIGLSVFAHNLRAKNLYERQGYEVKSKSPLNFDMIKKLSSN